MTGRSRAACGGEPGRRVRPRALHGLLVLGVLVLVVATTAGGAGGLAGDARVLEEVARLRTPWLTAVAEAVSRTGDVLVAVPVLVAAVWVWRRGERSAAVVLAAATVLAPLVAEGLKQLVERSRPEAVEPLVATGTLSFPSGHAMTAVGAYGTIAVLLWQRRRRALAVTAGTWAVLVGATRVYLGVHYPTDVLGSLAAGAVLLVVLAGLHARWLRRHPRAGPTAPRSPGRRPVSCSSARPGPRRAGRRRRSRPRPS